jgi:hypothetical protein
MGGKSEYHPWNGRQIDYFNFFLQTRSDGQNGGFFFSGVKLSK